MTEQTKKAGLSRRGLLLGGAGAATIVVASRGAGGGAVSAQPEAAPLTDAALAVAGVPDVHLAATDGWVAMPDAVQPDLAPFWPDNMAPAPQNLYVFGFRNVTNMTDAEVSQQRGLAQISAPQLQFKQEQDYRVKLSNLGLVIRPDLVDGHTIHWHGFVNAVPLFDGVPELSISVPIGRSFTYYYKPHDPGTYMYHCHFEDVEHVQMGMTGLLSVTPTQTGTPFTYQGKTYTKFVYNDGNGSTGYDREFGMILTEIFAEGHYRDAHIQTTDWTDFKASFWCINGRSYPDTLAPNAAIDPGSPSTVTVNVSAAAANLTTRVVTLTPTGGTAAFSVGQQITVAGFATTGPANQQNGGFNVTNVAITGKTATTITYVSPSGTLHTTVTGGGLNNARISYTVPADPNRTRGFDPTLTPDTDRLKWQPQSALVTANAGDRVLLRIASLGYQNHAMTLDNVPLTIVGKDALQLKNGATEHYITTNTVEVGPGESRDVLFLAPTFRGDNPAHPTYDSYLLYDRNLAYASNAGDPASAGGMVTEIRVYAAGTLAAQSRPNV